MSHLVIDELSVGYPGTAAPTVERLSLSLARGQIGCLLGASGCGKTTVLRAIAGFLRPSAGSIDLDGGRIASPDGGLPPEARRVGMVFQDFALFPHLDVRGNVAFGLREGPAKLSGAARAARVDEMLDLVNLRDRGDAYPHELSGGQQQRIALARALAPRPALLLLDEPFSSLDVELRERLSLEVRAILKETATTAILVTHDQREAFVMCDRVGVMLDGHIEQWAAPYELYHEPATRYVADFVGEGVFLPGTRIDAIGTEGIGTDGIGTDGIGEQGHGADHTHVQTELGFITPPDNCTHSHRPGRPVDVLLRPDDIIHDDAASLRATIVRKAFRGADFLYTLRLPSGREVLTLVPSHHDHAVGEAIGIRLAAEHVVTFDAGPNDGRSNNAQTNAE